ncbi:MAG: IS630 family transposase [Hormoscilla sp. SP5CHS1]|nr:IS630 family transposase [Hormoscilla sp. SP5CHS1]
MPKNKYIITLTSSEREALSQMTRVGKAAAHKLTHVRILLKADINQSNGGWTDSQISEALDVSQSTIERVRKRFVEEGVEAALSRQKSSQHKKRRLDGEKEAHLIALACSSPPEGHARWTIRLLADKLVELEIVESISPETVRQTLKKNDLKPWLNKSWVIPPEANAEFVCQMEDVLDVYNRGSSDRY